MLLSKALIFIAGITGLARASDINKADTWVPPSIDSLTSVPCLNQCWRNNSATFNIEAPTRDEWCKDKSKDEYTTWNAEYIEPCIMKTCPSDPGYEKHKWTMQIFKDNKKMLEEVKYIRKQACGL